MSRWLVRLVAAVSVVLLVPLQTGGAQAQQVPQGWRQEALAEFGVQQVAKSEPSAAEVAGTEPPRSVNPYLVSVPDAEADYHYWRTLLDRRGEQRAAQRATALAIPALDVDEQEPPDTSGANDTLDSGQVITELGTGAGAQRDSRIRGSLAVPPGSATPIGPFAEDDGAIPLANPTGLDGSGVQVRVSGAIGDGPHGKAGDGTGDFDFFAIAAVEAGQVLTVDVDAFRPPADLLDPLVAVTDASGAILAVNDDESTSPDSFLQVAVPAAGDYYVALTAFQSLPANPFDPGSGSGATTEGPYALSIGLDVVEDVDVYRFDLAAGDVLGASLDGGATVLGVFDPQGRQVMGAGLDLSASYPEDTQLLGGGNAVVDHVAAAAGPHSLVVSRGAGDYEARVRLRRPGLESGAPGARQVLFIDFDGAELNTNIFADALGASGGVRTLTPMAAFIGGCGLGPQDEDALIDTVVAAVTENYLGDLTGGVNPAFDLEIRNSRDHADPWGEDNVSRVIVGGTREEVGNPDATFNGVAQSIDPGNFDAEETGLVLMDRVCAEPGTVPLSGRDFLGPDSDVIAGIGGVLGFVVSHESGHTFGDWHTDSDDGVASIMDRFDLTQLGFGPDGFAGTDDDVDVDFAEDAFETVERFQGLEDTGARNAFALSTPLAGVPVAPDGVEVRVTANAARVRWSRVEEPVTRYLVRAVADGATVATLEAGAEDTRVRFRRLPAGTYTFTVSAVNERGEGPPASSPAVTVPG